MAARLHSQVINLTVYLSTLRTLAIVLFKTSTVNVCYSCARIRETRAQNLTEQLIYRFHTCSFLLRRASMLDLEVKGSLYMYSCNMNGAKFLTI